MRNVILRLYVVLCVSVLSGCSAASNVGKIDNSKTTAPEIAEVQPVRSKLSKPGKLKLDQYSKIALKPIKKTDTIKPEQKGENFKVMGTLYLETVFGKKDAEYDAKFIYIGGNGFSVDSTATWKYSYHDSWEERKNPGRGQLKYKRNKVMEALKVDDVLAVGLKRDNSIDIIVIPQGDSAITEIYSYMSSMSSDEFASMAKARPVETVKSYYEEYDNKDSDAEFDMSNLTTLKATINIDNETGNSVVIGYVTRIVDGDTIIVADVFNGRLVGSDAPESSQRCRDASGVEFTCGAKATAHLKKIIGKGQVRCELGGKPDRFGRYKMSCKKANGVNIAEQMVKDGFAFVSHYAPYPYKEQEAAAMKNKLGLWASEVQYPHCYRHRTKQDWVMQICNGRPVYKGWKAHGYEQKEK